MTIDELKALSEQYTPAQGYHYCVLQDTDGIVLMEEMDEDGKEYHCCDSCLIEYKKELEEKFANKPFGADDDIVDTVRLVEDSYSRSDIPQCKKCGKSIATGELVAIKGWIYDDIAEMPIDEFKKELEENPRFAWEVYKILEDCTSAASTQLILNKVVSL